MRVGQWTIVRVGLRNAAMVKHRERVIALLAVEGLAQMEANLFVHPRRAAERLYDALPARARADVVIVRGALAGDEARVALVASLLTKPKDEQADSHRAARERATRRPGCAARCAEL